MQLYNQTYIPREDMLCLPSAPLHVTLKHRPTPTHAIAIITQTDTSLHYINTPLKANQRATPTKAFRLSINQTKKNKHTYRLGDLRLGLPPSRGPPFQWHPSCRHPSHPSQGHPSRRHPSQRHPSRGHPSQRHPSQGHPSRGHPSQGHPSRFHPSQGRVGDIRLRVIRLGYIRLRTIRLGVIRLRDIRLRAIRLGDVRLRDCEGQTGWHRRISPRRKGIKMEGPPVLAFHLRDIRLRLQPVPAVSGTSHSVFRLGDSLQFNTSKYT